LQLDSSGPAVDQLAALDSVLFLRDPFSVLSLMNWFNSGSDLNTRVVVFATNLQLAQAEMSSAVVVNLVDSTNQSFDITAEDVRPVPGFEVTQVIFRLPDKLTAGNCTVKLKVHSQVSNSGTIRIKT
jgi:hypothetical protein